MVDITKIDTFVQSSPHAAWLATRDGGCIYANPALERYTGLNSDEINQADWRSFLLEEDRAAATASWQRSVATGTPYRMRVRMRGFDGVPATVELIAFRRIARQYQTAKSGRGRMVPCADCASARPGSGSELTPPQFS
jgi:PAS domain S-box-containing protein